MKLFLILFFGVAQVLARPGSEGKRFKCNPCAPPPPPTPPTPPPNPNPTFSGPNVIDFNAEDNRLLRIISGLDHQLLTVVENRNRLLARRANLQERLEDAEENVEDMRLNIIDVNDEMNQAINHALVEFYNQRLHIFNNQMTSFQNAQNEAQEAINELNQRIEVLDRQELELRDQLYDATVQFHARRIQCILADKHGNILPRRPRSVTFDVNGNIIQKELRSVRSAKHWLCSFAQPPVPEYPHPISES